MDSIKPLGSEGILKPLWKAALVFAGFLSIPAYAQPTDDKLLKSGIAALASDDSKVAFSQFIEVFQIVKPHPEPEVQGFIDRAITGDAGSFALIAYYVWNGHAGFRENKVVAKLALIRAMNEGSSAAAFFIAGTFLRSDSTTEKEKVDNLLTGIEWLGISTGMGETRAHTEAMRLIDGTAKGDDKIRHGLMAVYNKGLESSKTFRRK